MKRKLKQTLEILKVAGPLIQAGIFLANHFPWHWPWPF